jgi:hypothetical protein
MKAYGGVDVQIHIFLTSVLVEVSGQLHAPAALTPPRGKSVRYPLDSRLGGPTAGLDDMEKKKILPPPGLELRPLGRSARSQSLYRLRYPGSLDEPI